MVDQSIPSERCGISTLSHNFLYNVIPGLLYFPTEEAHHWQDSNDPSMKFWSSIKGDLKEKVHNNQRLL